MGHICLEAECTLGNLGCAGACGQAVRVPQGSDRHPTPQWLEGCPAGFWAPWRCGVAECGAAPGGVGAGLDRGRKLGSLLSSASDAPIILATPGEAAPGPWPRGQQAVGVPGLWGAFAPVMS